MYNRPDRPLIVKCSYDTWHKKITFSSARNCTHAVLKQKVEQCFSLSSTPFCIAYKDDDSEIIIISTDTDLADAIQYFQAGDDAILSSAASILSGRSFGSRKVTLRVHVVAEYDGPSLSDTSSLASLDDYRRQNGSQFSFSFTAPTGFEDDSVTVSSRNNSTLSATTSCTADQRPSPEGSEAFTVLSHPTAVPHFGVTESIHTELSPEIITNNRKNYTNDAGNVFEQLQLHEEDLSDGWSSVDRDSLVKDDRGAAWLRDQSERAIRSRLIPFPLPESDQVSSVASQAYEELTGALELKCDSHGRYYYTYTSSGSTSETNGSVFDKIYPAVASSRVPRPTSMHLSWLQSQQIQCQETSKPIECRTDPLPAVVFANKNVKSSQASHRMAVPISFPPVPPMDELTDCSECGALLDGIRYVCSTCGEKPPMRYNNFNGTEEILLPRSNYIYPTSSTNDLLHSSSQIFSSTSMMFNESSITLVPHFFSSLTRLRPKGYELCSRCLQSSGVDHAISAGSSLGLSSPIPSEDSQAASQWRRAAPKKGQLRHAYHEKVWGNTGWEAVHQDETQVSKCSTCEAITLRRRYKCASCTSINLCRACYSQVHELHPSHAFLTVPDKVFRSYFKPDHSNALNSHDEAQPLKHPGVRCSHCLLDIVGARFHCAICASVDICANCESAGLPGNLDSSDGGHTLQHILIKIPYPLETDELECASRWAMQLWTGRDAASVGLPASQPKPPSSVISSHARTVIATRGKAPQNNRIPHCNACSRQIIDIRYQCANCSSSPTAFNLCQMCEPRSYNLHDPFHVFFKLPRPVQRQIELPYPLAPILYKNNPIVPDSGHVESPKAYLQSLVHSSTLCDRCMTPIRGEWFRCAYCGLDLCDVCEEVDTHDESHVFMVFKSIVDMQIFRVFANLDAPDGKPPVVIPHPVYY